MRNKDRLSVGADADITVFDADQVMDRATFAEPNQFSKGIIHVLVGGTVVVRDERMVEGVFAGKPIRAKVKTGG
jgi:dihydroorotase